jgi:hypothetical protein
MRLPLLASAALFLFACSDTEVTPDAGDADAGALDAGGTDTGAVDGGPDAGGTDAGLDAGDTWNSYAMGFFQSYCVSCHSPGGGDPNTGDKNFTQYSSVVQYSSHIRCGVARTGTLQASWSCVESAEQFPIGSGPKPSGAERDRLVAWINAGTPQ